MAKKLDFSNKNFNFSDDEEVKNIEIKEGSVIQIPLSQIELGENIRDVFTDDESQLIQLGESIKEYGQLEPCIVYKENDKYIQQPIYGKRAYTDGVYYQPGGSLGTWGGNRLGVLVPHSPF